MNTILIGIISPWAVTAAFLISVGIILFQTPVLFRFIKKNLLLILLLLAITFIGGYIRFQWTPNQHRIYFDEDRYLAYAVTFARFGQELNINAASLQKVIDGPPDTVARVTVPTVNAWILKLFGYNELYLILGAKIFATFQILLLFAATYLLFKNIRTAVIASSIFSLLPVPVFWAPSIALDSYFVFFGLLAFCATIWYAKSPKFITALFLVLATLLLLFVRFEAFLFLLVQMSTIWAIRQSDGEKLFSKKDLAVVFLFTLLIIFRILISVSVFGQTWCCGEATPLEAFEVGNIFKNTLPNVVDLFGKLEFPFMITVLSLYTVFSYKSKKIVPLILWILFYFFIYSFYFAGKFFTFEFSGSNGRYFLMVIPPMVMLAAIALDNGIKKIREEKIKRKLIYVVLGVFLLLTLIPTALNYRKLVYLSPYDAVVDQAPRLIHEFTEFAFFPSVPKNALIIHSLTGLALMNNHPTIYYGSFLYDKRDISFLRSELKKGTPVYMLQSFTCDTTPDKCSLINPYFKIINVEMPTSHNAGRFVIAKLELKSASESARELNP
ncbi:MAG: hypothetical protein ACM3IJ_04445 [Candidatus Levyibacteriota bacterium]